MSVTSRDDYLSRINRAMDHIEAHLDEQLSLRDVAGVACFSPFHFHRVFAAMVGETLNQFIVRLRVEKAATQLLHNPDKPVTEVALDCGFSSSATFARSFRQHFGTTATQWRQGEGGTPTNKRASSKNCKTDSKNWEAPIEATVYRDVEHLAIRWRIEMDSSSPITAEVEIKEATPIHVAYIRHVGPYQGDDALFERLWGEMMGWAGPRGLLRPPQTKCVTIYHDNPDVTDHDKHRISVAISVPQGTPVEGAVGKTTIPGGTYAVAAFTIDASQYGDAWKALYGGWLPESGYQPDDRPSFELYLNDPKEHPEGKHIVQIWLPVKPR